MRNHEERKTEIYRRAEVIKKKEKCIKRTVLSAIPIVFCVTLIFAGIPLMSRDKGTDAEFPPPYDTITIGPASTNADSTANANNDMTVYGEYTESQIGFLMDIIDSNSPDSSRGDKETQVPPSALPGANDPHGAYSEYQVKFTDKNGVEHEYLITEKQIIDVKNKVKYDITKQEYELIKRNFNF